MERKFEWHGKVPKPEEVAKVLWEIRTLGGRIRNDYE
jgi:hypothetical protein